MNKLATFEREHPGCLYFLNVTDGLESWPMLRELGIDKDRIRFASVQSTHFEQKNLDAALTRLGPDLLMELALGRVCCLVDFGTDKELSRAVYQGVPFIRYALDRAWFDITDQHVSIKPRTSDADERDVTELYARWYHNLDRRTKGYLKRFRIYAQAVHTQTDEIEIPLFGISTATEHDGHPDYYASLAARLNESRNR